MLGYMCLFAASTDQIWELFWPATITWMFLFWHQDHPALYSEVSETWTFPSKLSKVYFTCLLQCRVQALWSSIFKTFQVIQSACGCWNFPIPSWHGTGNSRQQFWTTNSWQLYWGWNIVAQLPGEVPNTPWGYNMHGGPATCNTLDLL